MMYRLRTPHSSYTYCNKLTNMSNKQWVLSMEELNKCATIINHPSIIIHYKWVLFYFDNLIMEWNEKKNTSSINRHVTYSNLFVICMLFFYSVYFSLSILSWLTELNVNRVSPIIHNIYTVHCTHEIMSLRQNIPFIRSYSFFLSLQSSFDIYILLYSISLRNRILMPVLLSCCAHSFGNLLSSHDLFENISIDRFMSFKRIESACFDIRNENNWFSVSHS